MKYICSNCGTLDHIEHRARGSLLGELALWVLCVLIGPATLWISIIIAIIFSLWRALDKKHICGECHNDSLVSVSSPRGKKLLEQYHQ